MKFVIVTLAVVFNLTLVVMYSRGLVGGAASERKAAPSTPLPERSASGPYTPETSPAAKVASSKGAVATSEGSGEGKALEPVESGNGKETIDAKDGKELLEPVAEEVRPLRLRSGQGRPSAEIMGGSESRGILAPANRANLDPPVVSPEAR